MKIKQLQTDTYALSIAGLDPSGGAGLLADIKTFEAHHITGFGVCTALTMQTDAAFYGVDWVPAEKIIAQAVPLLQKFPVQYCKIGLIEHPDVLLEVLSALRSVRKDLRFILDPVLKASAGFVFHMNPQWENVLSQLYLLTPNYEEAIALSGEESGEAGAEKLAAYCAVLLKGGHRPGMPGVDTLYHVNGYTNFERAIGVQDNATAKHGSGCVLSAAITASLAKGLSLEEACGNGKAYTLRYLQSSPALLGHHVF